MDNKISLVKLPIIEKFYLEVNDYKGISSIIHCKVKVILNKNLPSLKEWCLYPL